MSLKKFRKGRPALSMQQVLRDHHEEAASFDQECREMFADLGMDDCDEAPFGSTPLPGESLYDLCDWDEPEDYGDSFYFGRESEDPFDFDFL